MATSDDELMHQPRLRFPPQASRKSGAKKNPPAFGAGGFRRRLAGLEVELELRVQAILYAVGARPHLAIEVFPFEDEVGLRHRRIDDVHDVAEVRLLQAGEGRGAGEARVARDMGV